MKRLGIAMILCCVFLLTACSGGDSVVEISDKLFIQQVNDVYLNADEYMQKTIKLEGAFVGYASESGESSYYYVRRLGPGCCGDDGFVGFEVVWNDTYPEEGDWVEAVGVPELYEEDGYEYLRLRLEELNVLEQRGEEYVES